MSKERKLKFVRIDGWTSSYWCKGNSELICSRGLRRHTDATSDEIEVVAVKEAAEGSNDYFDVTHNGKLVGVGDIDCDLQDWLAAGHKLGYRYVYVNELL